MPTNQEPSPHKSSIRETSIQESSIRESSVQESSIQELVDNYQAHNSSNETISIDDTAQQILHLFPQKLESSGYVILSCVALIFALFFMIQALLFRKLLVSIKEGHTTLKDMSSSLYTQQQLTEYRLLLSDLNYSTNPVEKANARTQLYNHLNTICIEICETRDKKFALQLAQIFFSKIQSRYLKLTSIPTGVIHFKYVSQYLLANPDEDIANSVKNIRKNVKEIR